MNLLINVPNDIINEYFYWLQMVDFYPLALTTKVMYKKCKENHHFMYFLRNINKMSCGEYYSIIIKHNNLYFFGFNIMTLNSTISSPKKVNKNAKIFSISCGGDYAVITSDKGTYSIGSHEYVQLNYQLINIVAIYTGNDFSLIMTKNHLYSVGCNNTGQLGLGFLSDSVTEPTPITFFDHHHIIHISVGDYHSIVTSDKGTYVFGSNTHLQLGLGNDYSCYTTPQLISFKNVISSSCGGHHSFIITTQGLYGCGSNIHGELGLSGQHYYGSFTLIPIDIPINDVISVTCGFNFTYINTADAIITLGDNFYGQLSVGKFKSLHSISCGYNHTIVKTNDNYYAMGSNKYNQLGLGKFKNKKYKVPKLIRI